MSVFHSNKMEEFHTPGSENSRIRTIWITKYSNYAINFQSQFETTQRIKAFVAKINV